MNQGEHNKIQTKPSTARPIYPFPVTEGYAISNGEIGDLVILLQVMLNAVSMYFDYPIFPLSGIFDENTAETVKKFQKAGRIMETGEVDVETWNRLAEEYNIAVNDRQ